MRAIFFEGMLLQAGLIFALGPQNLFVVESGLRRRFHLAVSLVCFLCDLSLIMLGVVGAATFFNQFPQIKIIIGILGVGFLILYGLGKIRTRDEINMDSEEFRRLTFRTTILKAITFSVVNPHAFLDGIVLIGGYSAKYSLLSDRVILGLGAASYSLLWFLVLSTGASAMMSLFKNPRVMKVMMGSAGVVLLFLSAKLSLDVYGWVVEMYPSLALGH